MLKSVIEGARSPQPRFRYYGCPQSYLRFAAVALTGRLRRGEQDVTALETRIAERTKAMHGLCVSQARLGIYLALRGLIQPGQKVILSPYTIFDVVNMVVCAGGRPVFADIEPDTCNIDPAQVEALIDGETGAVLATHLHGLACDIKKIADICRSRGVPLIEDAAQCFGGRVDAQHVGTFGVAGVFSFSLNKNVNALSGGLVLTSNQALHDRIAADLVLFPFEDTTPLLKRATTCFLGDLLTVPPIFQMLTFWLLRYDSLRDGQLVNRLVRTENRAVLRSVLPERYQRRMTSMQARLVWRQLERVDDDMRVRVDIARAYYRGLCDLPEVGLPPLREDGSHIYLSFPIQVPDRRQFVQYMIRHRCDVRIQSYANTADLPCFAAFARDCPNARATAGRVALLPIYPGYAKAQVEKTIKTIRRYFSRAETRFKRQAPA